MSERRILAEALRVQADDLEASTSPYIVPSDAQLRLDAKVRALRRAADLLDQEPSLTTVLAWDAGYAAGKLDAMRAPTTVEIRSNEDGSLDELLVYAAGQCVYHLEQMHETGWWMMAKADDRDVHVDLYYAKGKIRAMVREERP